MNKKILVTLASATMLTLGAGAINENINSNGNVVEAASKTKKLTHNAYVYNSKGKRVKVAKLKKGKKVKVYSYKHIKGKKYARIGKNKYIKVGNLKKKVKKSKRVSSKKSKKSIATTTKNITRESALKDLGVSQDLINDTSVGDIGDFTSPDIDHDYMGKNFCEIAVTNYLNEEGPKGLMLVANKDTYAKALGKSNKEANNTFNALIPKGTRIFIDEPYYAAAKGSQAIKVFNLNSGSKYYVSLADFDVDTKLTKKSEDYTLEVEGIAKNDLNLDFYANEDQDLDYSRYSSSLPYSEYKNYTGNFEDFYKTKELGLTGQKIPFTVKKGETVGLTNDPILVWYNNDFYYYVKDIDLSNAGSFDDMPSPDPVGHFIVKASDLADDN